MTIKIKEVANTIKRGLKPRDIMESKLFKDAVSNPDISLKDIFEAEDIIRERELNQWFKGHTTATITTIGGIAIGLGISALKNR